ncbi:hypothetical protein [Petroclostridium sp. X23]|uniref:hypothetical protein n=1 Tax=Petroclostridium sp. X23 TaxID=3045146 RepID=UPI0024AD72A2|nr:hypothetical protein [Petroclostridium sp. X23]WHH59936.1 hypothetical protein QKW49_04075 [Petroclostridium sp. X23]
MGFVGTIDRIENDDAFITVEDGMFEITVPVHVLRVNNYKIGDIITISIHNSELSVSKSV